MNIENFRDEISSPLVKHFTKFLNLFYQKSLILLARNISAIILSHWIWIFYIWKIDFENSCSLQQKSEK